MVKKIVKKLSAGILIASMIMSLAACGKSNKVSVSNKEGQNLLDGVETKKVDTSVDIDESDEFKKAYTESAINVFKQSTSTANANGENAMISPESIINALAMTANGATGETLAQMEQAVCAGMPIDDFNKYMLALNNKLADSDAKFNIANSIWIKNDGGIKVNDEFLVKDKTYYNADAYLTAFDSKTIEDINNWTKENTNGMIEKIIDNLSSDTVMCLVNAIAFEGKWEEQYKDYQVSEGETFTNANGESEQVTMLSSTEAMYIESANATGMIKRYEGGYGFMAILPNEGMSVDEYVNSLTAEEFQSLFENKEYVDVITKLPEFSYDYNVLLNDSYKALGMTDAFEETADFSNMGTTDTGALFISKIIHKTHIEVDRNGTKAAAATVVEMDKCTATIDEEEPKSVILDRPFVYAIVDMETGLPIFIGTVNTISE